MKKFLIVVSLFLGFLCPCAYAKTISSICFYYNNVDSTLELQNFDTVVLDPNNVSDRNIKALKSLGIKVYSYLSAGEFDGELTGDLSKYKKTDNKEWQSNIMDITAAKWHDHLVSEARSLLKRGFDGLFLDTLDSFNAYSSPDDDKAYYEKQIYGEKVLLEKLHKVSKNLIFNRGFEVLDKLKFKPVAVAAESIYKSYNAEHDSYYDVSKEDREWLSEQLNRVKAKGIDAIAIDYLDDSDLEARVLLAKKLVKDGYIPYVSDGLLNGFGVSTTYNIPKRILGLYDGRTTNQMNSAFQNRICTPLEYLGYAIDVLDINELDYRLIDKTRYAAVITYFDDANSFSEHPEFSEWIEKHVGYIKLLFIGVLPTADSTLNALGINFSPVAMVSPYTMSVEPKKMNKGLLKPTFSNLEDYFPYKVDTKKGFKVLAQIKGSDGQVSDMLVKAPWGGFAINPYPVDYLQNGQEIWLIDPFMFLDEMLNLKVIPAADATTESGNRILTSHVDGDGFPSHSWFKGSPLVSEVLYDEVYSKIKVPHTISIIEGEVGPDGLYPNQTKELEAVARKIFALDNVEAASHSLSHPFQWDSSMNKGELLYGEFLPIPNYKKLDYNREINGSIAYINTLCPKGKKVNVFLWTGDAAPTGDVVEMVDKLGLYNVNGGNTTIKNGEESLTNVSPTIIKFKNTVQVYAPQMNENVYTNEWTEHYDGFARAKETYELTGKPRRLKSIAIYYHMYSGTYPASLNALKSLYDYALSQDVTPMYLSEYAHRARTLYETSLGKTLNGQWLIVSNSIRSIRVPKEFGTPVSDDIVGFNDGVDGNYLILKKHHNLLSFTKAKEPQGVLLKNANGIVRKWQKNGNKVDFEIKSYIPLKFSVYAKNNCQLVTTDEFKDSKEGAVQVFTTENVGLFKGTLICN